MWHEVSVGADNFTFRMCDENATPQDIFAQLQSAFNSSHLGGNDDNTDISRLVYGLHEVFVSLLEEGMTPEDLDVDAMVDHWSTLYLCVAFRQFALVEAMLQFHSKNMARQLQSRKEAWIVTSEPVIVIDESLVPERVVQQLSFLKPFLQALTTSSGQHESSLDLKGVAVRVSSIHHLVDIATLWDVTNGEIDVLRDLKAKLLPRLEAVFSVTPQKTLVDMKVNLPAKILFLQQALPAKIETMQLSAAFPKLAPPVRAHSASSDFGRVSMSALCVLHELLVCHGSPSDAELNDRAKRIISRNVPEEEEGEHHPAFLLSLLFPLCLARRWTDPATRRVATAAIRYLLLSRISLMGYTCEPIRSQAQAFLELWISLPCEGKGEDVMRKFKSRAQLLSYISVGAWSKEPVEDEATEKLWLQLWRAFFDSAVVFLDQRLVAVHAEAARAAAKEEGEEEEGTSSSFADASELEDVRSDILAILSLMSSDDADDSEGASNATPMTLDDRFRSCEKKFAACSKGLDQATLLRFYAMFKQATVGDVNISAPWRIEMVARAKYDAWAALKSTLTKEEAKQKYCDMWAELAAKL